MKVAPAPAALTISTADTARGIRCRSRNPAAGDSMVPTTNAVTTGRKNALATYRTATTQITSSADQRESDHFGAADHRRQFAFAVGQR